MKKLVFLFVCMFSITMVKADNEKPIDVKQLPAKAQTFVSTYFKDQKVALVKEESGFFYKNYDVVFVSGEKVEFDKSGNWTEIQCKQSEVPAQAIPEAIRNYVKTNYPDAKIVEIEKACDVTADMHITAMKVLRPGMYEYEVVAEMNRVAESNNCELSFATIATINGQTLHNHYHGNKVKPGDLFLIDAGAEVESGYAGDMSSTIPADKKFTTRQREVYEIQNAMHLESVKALRPGIPYMDVYELSARVMVDGMKTLGLMKGNTEDAVREGAHALFYPHGLGHMMGLDVHDMENLGEIWVGYNGQPKSTQFGRKSQRLAIPLEPGFVHTVEPGIYFIPELIDMWRAEKKFTDFINYDKVETYKDFGGIRNEEDYLITETGARRLGKKIPLTPEEVEALR